MILAWASPFNSPISSAVNSGTKTDFLSTRVKAGHLILGGGGGGMLCN